MAVKHSAYQTDSQLRQEGFQIIYQILLANGVLGLIAASTFYLLSDLDQVDRFELFAVPLITILSLIIILLTINYTLKNDTAKGWHLTFLAIASYTGFGWFYFDYDVSGTMILMVLIYMIATQIMMDLRITISLGIIALLFTSGLYVYNAGETFSIGIGLILSIAQAIMLGGFATYRYIQLLQNYQLRMNNQLALLVEREERNAMLQQASRELMWDFDLQTGERVFLNTQDVMPEIFFAKTPDIKEWIKHIQSEDAEVLYELFMAVYRGELDYFEKEFRLLDPEKGPIWYLSRVVSKKNSEGNVIKMAGAYTQIHDKKLKELQVEHLAYYDELTGLPNRSAFIKDLESFLHETRGESEAILLYIDLQNFKEFNSSFGHLIGDRLIAEVAERLSKNVENSILYQLTSIDFGLLHFGDVSKAGMLAELVLSFFEQPFIVDGRELFVSAAIGISAYPSTALDAESLLRNADTALYHCRNTGMQSYLIYSTEMTDSVNYRLSLNHHMRQALDLNEFFMVFQPLTTVSGEKDQLYGFEALIRWKSPTLGFVRPDHFIPLAEESGMILNIGRFVLQESCKFLKQIVVFAPDIVLSINLSAKQIALDMFLPELLSIVDEAEVLPQNLSLEITETSFIESFESVQFKLNYLRAKGFKVALDDFGTGYSSLNYLGQLSIDTLKIDKSFTAKIEDDTSDYYLIKSIIALAKDLKINFVAEGVETYGQLMKLKEIGCPIIQGYYYSKPLEPDAALRYLKDFEI